VTRPEQVKSYDIFSEVGYYIFVVVCGDGCRFGSALFIRLTQLTTGAFLIFFAFGRGDRLALNIVNIRCIIIL